MALQAKNIPERVSREFRVRVFPQITLVQDGAGKLMASNHGYTKKPQWGQSEEPLGQGPPVTRIRPKNEQKGTPACTLRGQRVEAVGRVGRVASTHLEHSPRSTSPATLATAQNHAFEKG